MYACFLDRLSLPAATRECRISLYVAGVITGVVRPVKQSMYGVDKIMNCILTYHGGN